MNSRAQKQMGSNSSRLCPIRCQSQSSAITDVAVDSGWVRIASLFFLRHILSLLLFFIAKAVHI